MVLMNLGFNFFSGFRASEGESANETTVHFINRFYRSAGSLRGATTGAYSHTGTDASPPRARTPTGALAPALPTTNSLPGSERDFH